MTEPLIATISNLILWLLAFGYEMDASPELLDELAYIYTDFAAAVEGHLVAAYVAYPNMLETSEVLTALLADIAG